MTLVIMKSGAPRSQPPALRPRSPSAAPPSPVARSAAGWSDCDGNDLQLAGAGTPDGQRHLQSRLRSGAGLPAIDQVDLCAGEPADRRGLPMDESEDAGGKAAAE